MYPTVFVTIEFLRSQFPPTLSVQQVSAITSEHEQTIRNKLSKKLYPIPSFKIGRKRLFRLIDVAEYIDQQCFSDPSHPSNTLPKKGRPTKVQQLAKRQAQQKSQIVGS